MKNITLASGSRTRAQLLQNAGIVIEQKPASIDEVSLQASLVADGVSPRDISDILAEYKARQVAAGRAGLVLGCDQTLDLNGKLLNKAADRAAAVSKLLELQGKRHQLHSAAVIYEDGEPVWRAVRSAVLAIRPMTEDQISIYLDAAGEDVLNAVGCYHLEGIGAQLFTRVEGDYFTILGLPLLDILGFLRTRGIGL